MRTKYQYEGLGVDLISPWEVRPEELVWLHQAATAGCDKSQVKDVLDQAAMELAQIWRISAPQTRGIFVTKVLFYGDRRVLNIWLLGGVNILSQLWKMKILLREGALDHQCELIQSNTRPDLVRVYERSLGFKKDSVSMIMEV
jgi:hypothetical protein